MCVFCVLCVVCVVCCVLCVCVCVSVCGVWCVVCGVWCVVCVCACVCVCVSWVLWVGANKNAGVEVVPCLVVEVGATCNDLPNFEGQKGEQDVQKVVDAKVVALCQSLCFAVVVCAVDCAPEYVVFVHQFFVNSIYWFTIVNIVCWKTIFSKCYCYWLLFVVFVVVHKLVMPAQKGGMGVCVCVS